MFKGARIQFLLVVLSICTVAWAAMGATSQGVAVRFYWDADPGMGEFGLGMGDPVAYRLYQSRDEGPEELVAVTSDTVATVVVDQGGTVRFRVQGVDERGVVSIKSAWSEPIETMGVEQDLPAAELLGRNYPNPFNPATTISYRVPADLRPGDPLALEIYTVRGVRVRSLPIERDPGWHQVQWDGRDEGGRPAASGTYVSLYKAGQAVQSGKMTLLK